MTFTHETYLSPFTWRYGSPAMRAIWSEVNKRRVWRHIWVELARAQQTAGLVTAEQVADLEAHVDQIDIARAEAIEADIQHDLMAEVRTFAEQSPVGGGVIHLGATSADVEDNADVIRIRESLDLTLKSLRDLLCRFAQGIEQLADHPTMAYTHIQPAEPTTMGYRLALYAQDLLDDYQTLEIARQNLRGKGFKGAVGTRASYGELLAGTAVTPADLEAKVMAALDLPPYPIAGQTYPRKQDWQVLSALSGVAGSLYKFAFDLRILQSPVIDEWHEPFGKQQVGSSAMPFKRNPINAEKIDSLARLVVSMERVAWDNASHSLLERTLDDSANRREILPSAFLAADEMIRVSARIVSGLRIDEQAAARNFARFGTFSAVERVLMAAVKAGADRQEMHEQLRAHSLAAWSAIANGQPNPLVEALATSPALTIYLLPDQIRTLLDASDYVGDAPQRAREFAARITTLFSDQEKG
ncbi:MAG TPA: adenylosuccinate lyase [Phototrophicaceae bacterium]|nr:adenylosuccinate lyase [Phototrophicaceae bacterium]